jgi:hypothetical protein
LVSNFDAAGRPSSSSKSNRDDGTFNREDFTFDKERNVYICPAGKILTTTGRLVNYGETTLLYFASVLDCRSCPLRARYLPSKIFMLAANWTE